MFLPGKLMILGAFFFPTPPRCVSHGGLKDLDCSGNGLGDNGAAEVVEVRGPFLWEGRSGQVAIFQHAVCMLQGGP